MLYPQPLTAGDKEGLICPASPVPAAEFAYCIANVKALGFTPVVGNNAQKATRFLAGTDAERAADINNFFADTSIKGIFSLRGGCGSGRLLDLLDYELIKNNPKIFTGISDTTVIQNAILAKTDLVSFTGLMFRKPITGETLRTFKACVKGETVTYEKQTFAVPGTAKSLLVGGCLSLFVSLLGTDFMPDTAERIIVLEDVHSEPCQIDRMLWQLRFAKVFKNAAGVIFGNFLDCIAKDSADGTVEEVIAEHAAKMPCPCVTNFNYGHHSDSAVIPLGATVKISSADKTIAFNV